MNKHVIYTAAGVMFSLTIAFCGWILTNTLLDGQETMLLAATGSFHDPSANDETMTANTDLKLEAEEIAKILGNWNTLGSYTRPHEPVEGQLNMEQAITAAKDGLSYLSKQGIIPKEFLEEKFNRTNASLCQNQPATMDGNKSSYTMVKVELPPEYSYWDITFDNKKVGVQLTLNAVTGKMWKVHIVSYQDMDTFNNLDLEDLIKMYAAYLGLEGGDSLSVSETMASKGFEGDIISIVAVKIVNSDSV